MLFLTTNAFYHNILCIMKNNSQLYNLRNDDKKYSNAHLTSPFFNCSTSHIITCFYNQNPLNCEQLKQTTFVNSELKGIDNVLLLRFYDLSKYFIILFHFYVAIDDVSSLHCTFSLVKIPQYITIVFQI